MLRNPIISTEIIDTGFTSSSTIKPMEEIAIPSHCKRVETARKNKIPTINVHKGVVAFNTDAMLLVNLVSANPMIAHGIAVLIKAATTIGSQGICLNAKGFFQISMIDTIVTKPKAERRNAIVHGPKS